MGSDDVTILRELFADFLHRQWSGWMEYLFSKGTLNPDGTWTMPSWAVERWQRQMNTSFANLSDIEQDTDRKEADKMLEVLQRWEEY